LNNVIGIRVDSTDGGFFHRVKIWIKERVPKHSSYPASVNLPLPGRVIDIRRVDAVIDPRILIN
jgi:hypothetical protein